MGAVRSAPTGVIKQAGGVGAGGGAPTWVIEQGGGVGAGAVSRSRGGVDLFFACFVAVSEGGGRFGVLTGARVLS